MGYYMNPVSGQITIALLTIVPILIKLTITILAVIFLIKAIRYIDRKKHRENQEIYQREKNTLDELEKELNEKQRQERRSR